MGQLIGLSSVGVPVKASDENKTHFVYSWKVW